MSLLQNQLEEFQDYVEYMKKPDPGVNILLLVEDFAQLCRFILVSVGRPKKQSAELLKLVNDIFDDGQDKLRKSTDPQIREAANFIAIASKTLWKEDPFSD
jgi:hypothetical protein